MRLWLRVMVLMVFLTSCASLSPSVATGDITTGLVGHWKFDEGIGTTAGDASGNNNTGVLTNGPVWAAGKIGQALSFDKVDDIVNAASGASLDDVQLQGGGGLTASLWLNPASLGEANAGMLLWKQWITLGGWNLYLGGTNKLIFYKDYSTTDLQAHSVNNTITLSQWQHLVVTWDGSATASTGVKFYKDGVVVAHGTDINGSGNLVSDAGGGLLIGNNGSAQVTVEGLIDDVRIYNRVLTAEDVAALFALGTAAPGVVHSVQSGNWSSAAVWDVGRVPMAGDRVTIAPGHTVTYDVSSTADIVELTIDGTLAFSDAISTQLDVGLLVVESTGALVIGTQAAPLPTSVTATIRLVDIPDATYEHQHGLADIAPAIHTHGGRIEMYGTTSTVPWSLLAANASAGATTLTLANAVGDWQAGQKIVITGTNKIFVRGETETTPTSGFMTPEGCDLRTVSFSCLDPTKFQAEEATIQSVAGAVVTLTAPLTYAHLGTYPRQAAVGLLSRNIVITSKDPMGRRGTVMMAHGFVVADTDPLPTPLTDTVTAILHGVEFAHLGRLEPGIYPVHFHRLGNAGAQSALTFSSIHHGQNLCVRVHTTNFLAVEDNVCYETEGHGFATEDGTEVYNSFDHNLAVRTKHTAQPNPNDSTDKNEGSGFWINHPKNYVTNNYASDADGWGYQIDPIAPGSPFPVGKSLVVVDINGNPLPAENVTTIPILDFGGNISQGNYFGAAEIINLNTVAENVIIDFLGMDGRFSNLALLGTRFRLENVRVERGTTANIERADVTMYNALADGTLGTILTHPRYVQHNDSYIGKLRRGYQFEGSLAFDNTKVLHYHNISYGIGELAIFEGTNRADLITLNSVSFPDGSSTQHEMYLFDQDGAGQHVKLIPSKSRPVDALTYTFSTRFSPTGGCGTPGVQDICFQEASFTGPAKTGVPIKLPLYFNAGALEDVTPDGDDPADLVDGDGRRWMLSMPFGAPPPGYTIPRIGHEAVSATILSSVNSSIYQTTAVALGIPYHGPVPMFYRVDVPNGTYHVDLFFIENWQGIPGYVTNRGVGTRKFDVKAEGVVKISQLDVYATVGLNTPHVQSFDVTVADGQLSLEWLATQRGMVSGIGVCTVAQVVNGRCPP